MHIVMNFCHLEGHNNNLCIQIKVDLLYSSIVSRLELCETLVIKFVPSSHMQGFFGITEFNLNTFLNE